jgi:hypothetical protein
MILVQKTVAKPIISSGFHSRTATDNPGLSAATHIQRFRNHSETASDSSLEPL